MQATGVLLLFCTSAYCLPTETFSTTTTNYEKTNTLISEILVLTFPSRNENVSIPCYTEEKQCCQKNLEIFMNATKTFIKEKKDIYAATYNSLREIQKFPLPGCNSEDSSCREMTVGFEIFEKELKSFLRQIQRYVSKGY